LKTGTSINWSSLKAGTDAVLMPNLSEVKTKLIK
jgi:hypothetical protein